MSNKCYLDFKFRDHRDLEKVGLGVKVEKMRSQTDLLITPQLLER